MEVIYTYEMEDDSQRTPFDSSVELRTHRHSELIISAGSRGPAMTSLEPSQQVFLQIMLARHVLAEPEVLTMYQKLAKKFNSPTHPFLPTIPRDSFE